MITSWKIIYQGIDNDKAKDSSPQSFHSNEQERRTWDIHGHDLFFKHELHRLYNRTRH